MKRQVLSRIAQFKQNIRPDEVKALKERQFVVVDLNEFKRQIKYKPPQPRWGQEGIEHKYDEEKVMRDKSHICETVKKIRES